MITAIPEFARCSPSQTSTCVNLINCCRRKLLCVWFSWNVAVALKFLLDRSKHVMELSDKWRRGSCNLRIISFPLVLGSLSFFAVLSLVFKYYPWRVPDFLPNAGVLKLSVVSFIKLTDKRLFCFKLSLRFARIQKATEWASKTPCRDSGILLWYVTTLYENSSGYLMFWMQCFRFRF